MQLGRTAKMQTLMMRLPGHGNKPLPVQVPWAVGRLGALDYSLLAIFLLIENGISYWLSFATLAVVIFLVRWGKVVVKGISDIPAFVLVVPFMFGSLILEINNSNDVTQDVLHICREAVFYLLLMAFFRGINSFFIIVDDKKLVFYLRIIGLFLTVLAVVQAYYINHGIYFGIPVDYYIQGQGTIPDAIALRWIHVRPAATFSEPSYLGFMSLSMLMMNRAFDRLGGLDTLTSVLLLTAGLLSQSLSYLLFVGIMFILGVYTNPRFSRYRSGITAGAIIGVLAIGLIGSTTYLGERVSNIGTADGDISTYVRIIGPVDVVPTLLAAHPLGIMSTDLLRQLDVFTGALGIAPEQYTNNAIINTIFYYGLFGPALVYFLLKGRDRMFGTYLFLVMAFNGTIFGPDKFVVVAFVALVYQFHIKQDNLIEATKRGVDGPTVSAPHSDPAIGRR